MSVRLGELRGVNGVKGGEGTVRVGVKAVGDARQPRVVGAAAASGETETEYYYGDESYHIRAKR